MLKWTNEFIILDLEIEYLQEEIFICLIQLHWTANKPSHPLPRHSNSIFSKTKTPTIIKVVPTESVFHGD